MGIGACMPQVSDIDINNELVIREHPYHPPLRGFCAVQGQFSLTRLTLSGSRGFDRRRVRQTMVSLRTAAPTLRGEAMFELPRYQYRGSVIGMA